jgi:CDP-diacylglycerol---glycerol-3-phosphate 3-phosphatidyltransferase
MTLLNIPNILSTVRLLLGPIIAFFLLWETDIALVFYLPFVLSIVAEITDLLDGYYARKYNKITNLGKILDPLSDSLYRMTVFFVFAATQQVSIFLVLPILYRDAIVITLRQFCAEKKIVVSARSSGKIKALVQGPVIILILFLRILFYHGYLTQTHMYYTANGLIAIACAVTLWSAIDYTCGLYPLLLKKENS